jgi:magnesium-transporting ATPase (P-type)
MRWLKKRIFGTKCIIIFYYSFCFVFVLFSAQALEGASENEKKNCDVIYFHFSPNETFVRQERTSRENKSININVFFFVFILHPGNVLFEFHGQQLSLNIGFIVLGLPFVHTISEVRKNDNKEIGFSRHLDRSDSIRLILKSFTFFVSAQ